MRTERFVMQGDGLDQIPVGTVITFTLDGKSATVEVIEKRKNTVGVETDRSDAFKEMFLSRADLRAIKVERVRHANRRHV